MVCRSIVLDRLGVILTNKIFEQLQYKGDIPSLDFVSSIKPIPDSDNEMFIKFAKRMLT